MSDPSDRVVAAFDAGQSIRCVDAATLAAVVNALGPGRAVHVVVLHDEGCTPTSCACEPEYVVEPLTVETLTAGAEAEAVWRQGAA